MLSSALLFAALALSAAFAPPSGALSPPLHHSRQPVRYASALFYSNSESGDEPLLPPELRRQVERSPRRIPRRAKPHVRNASRAEAATRAGYIIPRDEMRLESGADNTVKNWQEPQPWQQQPTEPDVRPLRSIRRIVHRSRQEESSRGLPQDELSQIRIEAPNPKSPLDVRVRNRSNGKRPRLSMSRYPQLDEFLDKPQQLPPIEERRKGARRVTFKATREASKSLVSMPMATLTEYMTQPVSRYSLLSFHDAGGSKDSEQRNSDSDLRKPNRSKQRRWLVRRLTTEEAQRYIGTATSEETAMDESNLFRLAVPLFPLIGWDLTPVIDLEVIPPENDNRVVEKVPIDDPDETSSSDWAPLKGIRKRIRESGNDASSDVDHPPAVKIRSLRVSLLSTEEEVEAVMSNNDSRSNNKGGSNMQKEAIEMVGKVEEWLKPHISFEAELSWNDNLLSTDVAAKSTPFSTVTVKSTAITSLTIPMIPSDIIRKTVPSAFLVKRLGATLTSQALAICLPRFLRQLEKDYIRWAGLESGAGSADKMDDISRDFR